MNVSDCDTATETSRLREWRLRNKLTLVDVSGLTGYNDGFLSRLERKQRNLPPLERVRFARAVGARVDELFDPAGLGDEEESA